MQRGGSNSYTLEYLEVITRAWREETLSFDGRFVSFDSVATGPLPVRRPPVWVGGASNAALRRAVRFGDAWHPLNQRLAWLRDEGIPALRREAEAADRPVPAFAPRVPLRLTDHPLDDTRLAGQGTLDQILRDLDDLADLGATDVLFDTYSGHPGDHRAPAEDQRTLDILASKILDD